MGCQKVKCVECGNPVKKCNTINGKCPYCAGKKK